MLEAEELAEAAASSSHALTTSVGLSGPFCSDQHTTPRRLSIASEGGCACGGRAVRYRWAGGLLSPPYTTLAR
eukprot:4340668-Prymnesium_polylepis.1